MYLLGALCCPNDVCKGIFTQRGETATHAPPCPFYNECYYSFHSFPRWLAAGIVFIPERIER